VAEARWCGCLPLAAIATDSYNGTSGVALRFVLIDKTHLKNKINLGLYKDDIIWYNLKKTRKAALICNSVHKVRFSFLPGNTGCALPKAKPVLPALFPHRGDFLF